MGLLTSPASPATAALAAAALAACYAPEVRDCALACSSSVDCVAGQVCGDDRLCAAPALAGRCAALADDGAHDASPPAGLDAGAGVEAGPDAGAGVEAGPDAGGADAPPTATLAVELSGRGAVQLDGVGACSSEPPQDGSCAFAVPLGTSLTLRALPALDWTFEGWHDGPCAGSLAPTCTLVLAGDVGADARFRRQAHP